MNHKHINNEEFMMEDTMNKKLKITGIISFILGFISFCWLIYNFIAYEYIRPLTLTGIDVGPTVEKVANFIWFGFMVSFLFHFIAGLNIIFQLRFFKKVNGLRIAILLFGILSFIHLIGDWGLLNDIGKEYKMGWEVEGEWLMLYLNFIPHVTFHILMMVLLLFTFRTLRAHYKPEVVVKDEVIFTAAQYVGILCGLMGLGYTFFMIILDVPLKVLKFHIPFFCPFLILPYGCIAFYWLLMKIKEKPSDWYDEKQWRDVTKAGLTALVLSVPVMSFMFVLNYFALYTAAELLWFPYYMFFILLIFSGSTLYYYKKG